MENNQTGTTQEQPIMQAPQVLKKSNVLVMGLGGIVLVGLGLLGGYFLFGNKSQQSTPNSQPVAQVSPTEIPSPTSFIENTNWKTESFQYKSKSAVSGNETVTVSFQLPSNWTMQSFSRPSECPSYSVMSADKVTVITIAPICNDWSAEYKPWPSSTVIVKDLGQVGNDNHAAAIVRYPGMHANTFIYAEGFKSQNQVQDAMMLYYGSKFLPTNVSVNASDIAPDTKTSDQIVASITAK